MKRLLTLNEMFWTERQNKLNTWLDKLTFPRIFLLWTSVVAGFGFVYRFLSNDINYLFYVHQGQPVHDIIDSVYFSFITATSTGFGDIIPFGYFKIIAIVEVIFGLVLLAFVTSKLVSIKQNVILNEVYEISFHEKINRVRSSLLLFRQNVGRVIDRIEDKSIRSREVSDLYTFISSLEDTLNEISMLMKRQGKTHFTKILDPLDAELIFHSITHSLEKLAELIHILNNSGLDWRREVTINFIQRCISLDYSLLDMLEDSRSLSEKTSSDVRQQNEKAVHKIEQYLNEHAKIEQTDVLP
jgi:potassium channel LctB